MCLKFKKLFDVICKKMIVLFNHKIKQTISFASFTALSKIFILVIFIVLNKI